MIKDRIAHIDLLESIAIFFVVLYHSTLYQFDITSRGTVLNYFLYFGRTILSTGVPLFFFVNGYLLLNKELIIEKHIKRIIKTICLCFFVPFILLPIYMLFEGEPLHIKKIVMSILYMDISWSINIFWFLGALICIYFLFPALKALFDTSKKNFVFFTVVCASFTFGVVFVNFVLSFLGTLLHHDLPNLEYPFFSMFIPFQNSCGYTFVYFCVGGLAYLYEDKIRIIPKMKRTLFSIMGILVSCIMLFLVGVYYTKTVNGELWDVVWNGYNTVFTFFNVIFIYIISLNYVWSYKTIKNISFNTLGIFFTHELIIRLTRPWILKEHFLCNLPVNILYALLIVLVCTALCRLFRKFILKRLRHSTD